MLAQADRIILVFYETWLFLTLVLWRQNGMSDSHEGLVAFAEKMASTFDIHDLLQNWADSNFINAALANHKQAIANSMRDLQRSVDNRATSS